MIKKRPETYQLRAQVAKALAHPSRLLIIDALTEREHCVCELTELVGADQSTVSKHLAVLKNSGLVDCRKDGTMIYYRMQAVCLEGFFECVESVIGERIRWQQVALG